AAIPLKTLLVNENDISKYWSSSAIPVKGSDEGNEFTMAWVIDFNISGGGLKFGYTGESGFDITNYSLFNVRAMRIF
ncbi:MAG TPA: hypothetical protein P5084_13700, partial [Paludibacter sp.]|nr:hypothetical protein [Paludibacter sp.]